MRGTELAERSDAPAALRRFKDSLLGPDSVSELKRGLIGAEMMISGPYGLKPFLYADYVASGRALRQVEDFVARDVLPFYANVHSAASYCGSYMTHLREAARAEIGRLVGAGGDCAVIFAGAGATAGINRLPALLGVTDAMRCGTRPLIFVGPYEHHSNLLPWRESGAEIIEIPEGPDGGPDIATLDRALSESNDRHLRIGAFSAMSNVTGIVTDTDRVTKMLKSRGALAVWDYAGGGPYLPIDMSPGAEEKKDAVVISCHKFVGGPGASGILVIRKSIVVTDRPTFPGGGTVSFVSPWGHDYVADVASREEAGTPNVIGDIRAALAFLVKEAITQEFIDRRHRELNERALSVWQSNPRLELLGLEKGSRLPVFSFRVRDGQGGFIHHQLFTRMLSDCHGIQARGGCACAGPYAHRLLGIDRLESEEIQRTIEGGNEIGKPGWIRLNLSYLLDDHQADMIIEAVDQLARSPYPIANAYMCDPSTARFVHRDSCHEYG